MAKLLKQLGSGQGYLKAGFLGFPKSGKTYTAALLAIAAKRQFKIDGPLAMFDTEGGSEYIADMVLELTGSQLIGVRSRSFDDMLATARECESDGVKILLVDSVTHPWRELCDAFLKKVNDKRKASRKPPRNRLEFQDWNHIKGTWSAWTDWYLNSPVHVIICGRAGFEYDYDVNDETGRKELVKTGVKMKTETEFGFEPSLLVEMEREQKREPKIELIHRAVVLGDRFGIIDGATQEFRTGKNKEKELETVLKFFAPHLHKLTPQAHAPIDTQVKSDLDVDENGDSEWRNERRQRTILAEEIEQFLRKHYPSQSVNDKQARFDLMELAFGTRSWTKISESTPSDKLRDGLEVMRAELAAEFEREVIGDDDIPGDDNGFGDNTRLFNLALARYIASNTKIVPKGKQIDKTLWMAEARSVDKPLTDDESAMAEFNANITLEKVLVDAA